MENEQAEVKNEGLEFWRCYKCPTVISPWDVKKQIAKDGKVLCPRCGSNQLREANLRWHEKIIQIIKHPAVWKWKEVDING